MHHSMRRVEECGHPVKAGMHYSDRTDGDGAGRADVSRVDVDGVAEGGVAVNGVKAGGDKVEKVEADRDETGGVVNLRKELAPKNVARVCTDRRERRRGSGAVGRG